MLTFDQSASLICFSPLTACEQELYKHVLPPREANGSLLITGEAGRRAVHSKPLLWDPTGWKHAWRMRKRTFVYTNTRKLTHTTAHLAGGLACKARWMTTKSRENKREQPWFYFFARVPRAAVSRTAYNETPLCSLILFIFPPQIN